MTLPPDFATVATLRQPILCTELHFLAILQNSYQDRPYWVAATTELGTHLWKINPPNFCLLSIEGLTKFGG
jgi:hypothetical protein